MGHGWDECPFVSVPRWKAFSSTEHDRWNGRTGGEEATRELVWRRPVNSANVRIAGAGHLVGESFFCLLCCC